MGGKRAPSINIGWTDEIVLYCIWQLMTVYCRTAVVTVGHDDAIGLARGLPRSFLHYNLQVSSIFQVVAAAAAAEQGRKEFSLDWQLSVRLNIQPNQTFFGSWCMNS